MREIRSTDPRTKASRQNNTWRKCMRRERPRGSSTFFFFLSALHMPSSGPRSSLQGAGNPQIQAVHRTQRAKKPKFITAGPRSSLQGAGDPQVKAAHRTPRAKKPKFITAGEFSAGLLSRRQRCKLHYLPPHNARGESSVTALLHLTSRISVQKMPASAWSSFSATTVGRSSASARCAQVLMRASSAASHA